MPRNQARSLQFMGCVWALPSHIVGMSLHRLRVLSHGAGPGLAMVRGCIGAITGMAQTGALWAVIRQPLAPGQGPLSAESDSDAAENISAEPEWQPGENSHL